MRKFVFFSLAAVLMLSACADVATMKKASDQRAGFAPVSDLSRRAAGAVLDNSDDHRTTPAMTVG